MPPPTQQSGINCGLTIEELLFGIVSALVDNRNDVQVSSKTELAGKIFQVTVTASEAGKIIGKNGRTATSIRGLLSAMGVAAKTRYGLENNNKALTLQPSVS
jgi:predicted RNA-binding protein YlqC (UPF0109 family)